MRGSPVYFGTVWLVLWLIPCCPKGNRAPITGGGGPERRHPKSEPSKRGTGSSTGDAAARVRQLEAELARERARREAAEAKASPTTDALLNLKPSCASTR